MPAVPIVQFLFAAVACLGLWRLCRAQPRIIIAGFLVRTLAGQALFWISYLRLPVARSLQSGDGFWFFAVDGPFYLGYATELAARGPAAILLDPEKYPSQFFVEVLSLCVGAFGSVASVALLLNGAAYLLTSAIIVGAFQTRDDFVLAAIALSPASILFSLQPLKDTLFLLLIVAMVAAFRRWEEWWRASRAGARFLGHGLAMCAVIYALAGIRWYFAVIAWAAATLFLVLTSLQARRKAWAFAAHAVLMILLAQCIRVGAHDLQPSYDRLLNPMTALQWRPSASKEHLATVRRGFESTPGATTIAQGDALGQSDQPPPVAVAAIAEVETPPHRPEVAAEITEEIAPTMAPRIAPEVAAVNAPANSPRIEPSIEPKIAPEVAAENAPALKIAPGLAPEIAPTNSPKIEPQVEPNIEPKIATKTAPEIVPKEPASIFPPGLLSRITTGFAAMFLPRFLGESLGLIRVGGGRGLWLFAEVDTLLFDLVLLYGIVHCVRSLRRGARVTATFVFCVLLFVMTAGPMLYTVNNFGTLFRMRLMVYCIAAILPITLRDRALREAGDALP